MPLHGVPELGGSVRDACLSSAAPVLGASSPSPLILAPATTSTQASYAKRSHRADQVSYVRRVLLMTAHLCLL